MYKWRVFCADCKAEYVQGQAVKDCNWTPKPGICGVCGSKWIAVKREEKGG
jgi:hypothetical protein